MTEYEELTNPDNLLGNVLFQFFEVDDVEHYTSELRDHDEKFPGRTEPAKAISVAITPDLPLLPDAGLYTILAVVSMELTKRVGMERAMEEIQKLMMKQNPNMCITDIEPPNQER